MWQLNLNEWLRTIGISMIMLGQVAVGFFLMISNFIALCISAIIVFIGTAIAVYGIKLMNRQIEREETNASSL